MGSAPPAFAACAITTSAEIPVAYACPPVPAGGAAVSDWHSPCACPQPVGPVSGKLIPLMNRRLSACGASTCTALSLAAASDALVSAPVAPGKNLLPTTPQ